MHKDVECTFGILEKRFTILDHGIEAKSIKQADQVWLTCCALHNFILERDGMDEEWEADVVTEDGNNCFAIDCLTNVYDRPMVEIDDRFAAG